MAKGRALVYFIVFCITLGYIWYMPITIGNMNIHDWIKLILLEIPLQLAIHDFTEGECK